MPSSSLVARSDRVFQLLEELCRIHSHRLANGQKFHDVDAAFSALVFGHKRLRLMKAISQAATSQPFC
jgi:Ni,Fe-hydrogenase III large subunit